MTAGTPGGGTTDGRQLRRQRNRDAVVDALLDLLREGNLQPGTDAVAARAGLSPRSLFRYFDDMDDLTRTAVARQQELARPLIAVPARPDQPLADRVGSLVTQRSRLFETVAHALTVARLRAPFQSDLARRIRDNRAYLRSQLADLFGPELAALAPDRAAAALAAADLLTTFESYQLLVSDQGRSPEEARALLVGALMALLGPGHD